MSSSPSWPRRRSRHLARSLARSAPCVIDLDAENAPPPRAKLAAFVSAEVVVVLLLLLLLLYDLRRAKTLVLTQLCAHKAEPSLAVAVAADSV